MLLAILERTPHWVWLVLIGLIALGLSMSLPRRITLRRATVPALALLALSLQGVLSTFAHQPTAWVAWLAGLAAAAAAGTGRLGLERASFDPVTRLVSLPGSFIPLALMLSLFILKFAVGVGVAMDASLRTDAAFGAVVGLLYGAFSGLFLSRAVTAWLRARRAAVPMAALG